MAVINEDESNRKRRSHKKSRQGCRNCKLRRVKCDETRPKCTKCTSFGVACNYDPKAADLQMSFNGTFSAKNKSTQKVLSGSNPIRDFICALDDPREAFSNVIQAPATPYPTIFSNDNATFQLNRHTWDRLSRFQRRTVLTIGTNKTAEIYQSEITKLACSQPYLMHIIQTVTAIHDRFLAGIFNSHPSVTEVYHWTRAVALFNRKLSSPVQPQDRDALWATAALLGIVAFSCDATTVEEAWPLKDPESSDMEWLRMSEGKASVWVIADPMRPDSVFYPLAEEFARFEREYAISASIQSGKQCLSGIPSAFVKLFELDDMERVEMNPYYYAVHIVVDVLHKKCDQSTIVRFLSFISHMQQEFKKLLGQKDPKALLLLAYWYAKMYTIWWMQRRAILECQAICQYLERHYGNDVTLLELLQFPKMTMSAFVGS